MKERPIIFSAPMVRAILDGRKTQTRRVVKPQPPTGHDFAGFTTFSTCRADEGKAVWGAGDVRTMLREPHRVRCPYGQPGDRLWVREAWRVAECYDDRRGADLRFTLSARNVQYAAGDQFLGVVQGRYRHARFMPRWASRITLEIVSVRVERLQDISEADAIAEGLRVNLSKGLPAYSARQEFERLWESLNGPGSWDANPWVWVIEFKRAAQAKEGK